MANKTTQTMIAVLALAAWMADAKAQGALQPVSLRCALRVNPLGVGDVAPRLSWQLQSTGQARGETQSAYQIQVGSATGKADLWDSGKVTSAATVDILYAGQPLTSGKQCFWQVRVYDGSNNVSAWSTSAQWSMGLLAPADWTAQWIGYDAAYTLTPQQAASNALLNTSGLSWISFSGQTAQGGIYQSSLRKKVILPSGQTITNAVVALYADNACSVFVNGQQMTNSAARWEATAWINVTPWLHAGTNVLALGATNSDAQSSSLAPLTQILLRILPPQSDPFGVGQRCPGTTTSAGAGGGQNRRAPPSGRPAPSLRTPGGLRSRLLPPTGQSGRG